MDRAGDDHTLIAAPLPQETNNYQTLFVTSTYELGFITLQDGEYTTHNKPLALLCWEGTIKIGEGLSLSERDLYLSEAGVVHLRGTGRVLIMSCVWYFLIDISINILLEGGIIVLGFIVHDELILYEVEAIGLGLEGMEDHLGFLIIFFFIHCYQCLVHGGDGVDILPRICRIGNAEWEREFETV